MIHPEKVRSLVRQGRIPENGRVVRGSGFLAVCNVWRAAFLQFSIVIVSWSASFGWAEYFNLARKLDFTFLFEYPVMMMLMYIIVSFISISTAKNSAMVFLPDAYIQFTDIQYSNSYTCKVLRYASISDMQLKVSFWFGPCLMVRDQEGKKQKWYANPCFGERGRTLQDILTAYNTYTVVTSAPYLAQFPLQVQVQ